MNDRLSPVVREAMTDASEADTASDGRIKDSHNSEQETPQQEIEKARPQRYDLITNYRCGSSIEEMEPAHWAWR